MAKINLQEVFVVQMQRLLRDLQEINNPVPGESPPKWWLSMNFIRILAYEAVREFNTDQTKGIADDQSQLLALIYSKRMQVLCDHLAKEHNLLLLESEMQELERIIYPELYTHEDQHE